MRKIIEIIISFFFRKSPYKKEILDNCLTSYSSLKNSIKWIMTFTTLLMFFFGVSKTLREINSNYQSIKVAFFHFEIVAFMLLLSVFYLVIVLTKNIYIQPIVNWISDLLVLSLQALNISGKVFASYAAFMVYSFFLSIIFNLNLNFSFPNLALLIVGIAFFEVFNWGLIIIRIYICLAKEGKFRNSYIK